MKSTLHFLVLSGRDFHEGDTFFLSKFFAFFISNLSLTFKISFIANEQHFHGLVSIGFDLLHPVLQMFKCFSTGYVVNQKSSNSTTIVGPGNRFEILLSGGVPDLQFYCFHVHFQVFSSKLNADGHIVSEVHFLFDQL